MKVVVSSNGTDLDSPSNDQFGRCPTFVFVDTESMEFEAKANEAASAPSGAGIQAAQFVTGAGVQAVITGRVGPKASAVLETAGVQVHLFQGGTVRDAVEDFKAKKSLSDSKPSSAVAGSKTTSSPQEEIAALEGEVTQLRQRLAGLLEQIDQLSR
jgi:predicted Fe-Mo cluster-binding NifX family protein